MSKTGAEKVQATAIGHNKGELQKIIDSVVDLERKKATINAQIAKCYVDADDKGFDRKELKFIIKETSKPTPIEFKRGVNNMRRTLGQSDLFDLPDPKEEEAKAKKEAETQAKGKTDGKAA